MEKNKQKIQNNLSGDPLERTKRLIGSGGLATLEHSRVIVFGVGGVGGAAIEALARAGVGHLTLVDFDVVDVTNLNRQMFTSFDTIGQYKAIAMRNRIESYRLDCAVEVRLQKVLPKNLASFHLETYDYVLDCIDMVTAKIDMATFCFEHGIPIISAMGAGDKMDASALRISDLFETREDPLSRVMRRELRKRNVSKLEVVWSPETIMGTKIEEPDKRKSTVGTISVMPLTAGLLMGSQVIMRLLL